MFINQFVNQVDEKRVLEQINHRIHENVINQMRQRDKFEELFGK